MFSLFRMMWVGLLPTLVMAWLMFSCTTKPPQELRTTMPTEKVSKRPEHQPRPDREKIRYFIYKKNTTGLLYGNRCAVEVTQAMNFEYVVAPPGMAGSPNGFNRAVNNFSVKTVLFFTRGPFWKRNVKKRIRECRESTGDFVG